MSELKLVVERLDTICKKLEEEFDRGRWGVIDTIKHKHLDKDKLYKDYSVQYKLSKENYGNNVWGHYRLIEEEYYDKEKKEWCGIIYVPIARYYFIKIWYKSDMRVKNE